jgi:crotonobetainyl-CoA:carnitine CoA-transferase CaiB-like acyl-CoA transferase
MLGSYTALDLTDLPGQLAGRLLADLGMRVVKVEPPGGDPVRRIGPFKDDIPNPEGSLRFAFLNGGKTSTIAHGEADISRLAAGVDVVLESGTPGTLRHERLRQDYPQLVTVAITGFGESGPRRDWRATDAVVLAAGGLMSISGDPARPPVRAPETQGYYYGCAWAAFGALLALARGGGNHVEVSLQEAVASQEHMIREAAYDGVVVRREGSQHKHVAPARVFPCRDGHVYLFVSAAHWPAFLRIWSDHPAELEGEGWVSAAKRRARAEWLNEHVARFTSRHAKAELTELLQNAGIPCLPVNSPLEVLEDPHLAQRRFFGLVHHPYLGTYRAPTAPITVDGERLGGAPPPPIGGSKLRLPAPVRRPPEGAGPPLQGVRVLSLTTGIAGPTAARLLAQAGADVIKIESRAGGLDSFRFFADDLDASSRFLECNLGVRSVTLDLKRSESVALFRELLARSDVVLENFRPDVLPRLGLGYDELRAIRPEVVVVRMPGLGSSGPKSLYGTWGPTLAAFSGLTHLWNHADADEPVGSQGVYPDYLAAVLAPVAVVAALLRRRHTGEGALVDLSQAEAAAYALGVTYLDAAVNERSARPVGNACPGAALHGCYPSQGEDRWCVIVCPDEEAWRELCAQTGIPVDAADRDAAVAGWTAVRPAEEAAERLQAAGVPAAPVQDAADLAADPHLRTRGFVVKVRHPVLGEVELAGLPIRLAHGPLASTATAPLLGEHNEDVICGLLGRTPAELTALQADGVVY